MGIRRSDRVVVRPDGTVEHVASAEPSSEERAETEQLGDRFEELMQQDDRRTADQERDRQTSLLPARAPWRDPAQKAATAAADQATVGRDRDKDRAKESSTPGRADHDREDGSATAAQGATHAKERKGGDREGKGDSGGERQGDGSGALMALQAEAARPQAVGGAAADASAEQPSGARLISEVASEVAARITAASGHGSSQVRIDLREDVLPQTSMTIEDQPGMVVVSLSSGSHEASELLSSHAAELGRAISRRTGKSTRIDFAGQSWTTDADDSAAGDGHASDDGPDGG